MVWLFSAVYFALLFLNRKDFRKAEIAALFAIINFIDCFILLEGINAYLISMIPPAITILFCLYHSKCNWSLLVSLIMTSCIFINFLGMINATYFELNSGYYLYERAIMLTTFAEIAVLLAMSTRLLDGYFTDSTRRVWQYFARLLSFGINCNPYMARV